MEVFKVLLVLAAISRSSGSFINDSIKTLENLDDDILEKGVPGEHYNYYKLLNGLIQHDTYHLGMIWVLWE